MPISEPVFVTLKDGLTLPLPALRLAWALEERGLQLGIDGEALTVGPKDRLTQADHQQIRAWRDQLKRIVSYESETIQ